MKTTKTTAGHKITLSRGQRYVAGRPFAERGRKIYPITISKLGTGNPFHYPELTIDGLTYDEANDFLAAFNNGTSSFEGRVW